MRVRTIIAILVAAAAWAGLAQPASAARPRTYRQPAEDSVILAGRATNGFNFHFFGFGRYEALLVDKELPDEGHESVSYVARRRPAGVGHGRIDLRIGSLGHFRGHLVVSTSDDEPPEANCKGEVGASMTGHFVGSFVFRGERDYSTIHARRLLGAISHTPARECTYPTSKPDAHRGPFQKVRERLEKARERDETRLLAGDAKADLLFKAVREQAPPELEGGATVYYRVSTRGAKVDGFEISRSVSTQATGREAAMKYFAVPNLAEPRTEAILEPPAPFSGSATFRLEGPKTASWSGDLTVGLPGLGKVPLTGKGIYAGVCKGRRNCTETLPGLLGRLATGEGGFDGGNFVGAELQTIP